MNIAGADEVSEVLNRVKQWSPPSRISLARRILESLDTLDTAGATPESPSEPTIRGVPVEQVVGLLKTNREPPSDEECRQIVEEERWQKYGS
jgi:hypothetical protein